MNEELLNSGTPVHPGARWVTTGCAACKTGLNALFVISEAAEARSPMDT